MVCKIITLSRRDSGDYYSLKKATLRSTALLLIAFLLKYYYQQG